MIQRKPCMLQKLDTVETPKKKWIKSIQSTTKPPPSAAVGKAPKGCDEVKGLDAVADADYNNDVESEDAVGDPAQAPEPSQDEKP